MDHELHQEIRKQAANEGNSFGRVGLGRFDMGHPIRHVLRCIQFDRPATVTRICARVPPPEHSGRVAAAQAQGIAGSARGIQKTMLTVRLIIS